MIVCSAVDHFQERKGIRDTWMKMSQTNSSSSVTTTVQIAFLLGETWNETLQNDVYVESDKYQDVIQEGFHDSYLNLTLKSVFLLKWVTTYCPVASFVLKTDDDMFVNIANLVQYLSSPGQVQRRDLIVGSLFCRVTPVKDLSSKWYSPTFMFNEKVYPDYVSGTGYVIRLSIYLFYVL